MFQRPSLIDLEDTFAALVAEIAKRIELSQHAAVAQCLRSDLESLARTDAQSADLLPGREHGTARWVISDPDPVGAARDVINEARALPPAAIAHFRRRALEALDDLLRDHP